MPESSQLRKEITLDMFPFVKLENPITSHLFCVDGRKGLRTLKSKDGKITTLEEAYPQMLGGSLSSVVAYYVLGEKNSVPVRKEKGFIDIGTQVFNVLREKGFGLGLHGDKHAKEGHSSGCGFGDNLKKVIEHLRQNHTGEIWDILESSGLVTEANKEKWDKVIKRLKEINVNNDIPEGYKIIGRLRQEEGVAYQVLEGGHGERAAIINYVDETTLDTDRAQNPPAFNLDMWRVKAEAKALGIDVREAELLTLGLYIATEIALVEDKGKERLSILIKK